LKLLPQKKTSTIKNTPLKIEKKKYSGKSIPVVDRTVKTPKRKIQKYNNRKG